MLGELPFGLNSEPVKYTLVVLSAPFWWPFVKAMWEELNESLAEEGGLFGEEPDATELARMRGDYTRETPMVSDPWEKPSRGSAKVAAATRELEAEVERERRGGFRNR
ncbi:MAG: hypothetical protein IT453_13470 [Planctomycetes bacterium]|nr:hypothetical protein [Planctomycetota bacterium]